MDRRHGTQHEPVVPGSHDRRQEFRLPILAPIWPGQRPGRRANAERRRGPLHDHLRFRTAFRRSCFLPEHIRPLTCAEGLPASLSLVSQCAPSRFASCKAVMVFQLPRRESASSKGIWLLNTETAPNKMAKLICLIRFLRSKQPSGEGCHEMVFHF